MRLALLIVLANACVDTPGEPDVIEKTGGGTCPASSGCGENGATCEGSVISWLRLDGAPYKGIRYMHFALTKADMAVGNFLDNLDVNGNTLRYGQPGAWHTGAELIGTVMRVWKVDPVAPPIRYDIEITEVHDDLAYWTLFPSGAAESYRFVWNQVDGLARGELCPFDAEYPLWNHAFNAVVFEGEKYDNDTHAITLTPEQTGMYTASFNIACVGSLPMKQEMARRTTATISGMYATTIADDRQDLARAWAAEYCGGGHSFTHQGHKIQIMDRHGWLTAGLAGNTAQTEAVWKDGKAVCLDTPRMAVSDPKVPVELTIWDQIRAQCGTLRPPPCTGQSWFPLQWAQHGNFITTTAGEIVVKP